MASTEGHPAFIARYVIVIFVAGITVCFPHKQDKHLTKHQHLVQCGNSFCFKYAEKASKMPPQTHTHCLCMQKGELKGKLRIAVNKIHP